MKTNKSKVRGRLGELSCIVGLVLSSCDPGPAGSLPYDENSLPVSRDDGTAGSSPEASTDAAQAPHDASVSVDAHTLPVAPDAGLISDAAITAPRNCENAKLPTAGMVGRLTAGAGVTSDGSGVKDWQDQANPSRVATRQSGGPTLIPDAVAGRPALRFDGVDDVLHWPNWQLNGKKELTVALVNASDLKAPPQEWCCSDDETGCSGTYHVPLFWNGSADWSGILIAPVQGEVAIRFGNGVKHYSDNFYETFAFKLCSPGQPKCPGGIQTGSDPNCCGYGSCQLDWQRDPGVAWRRPASIGRDFGLSVTVKRPSEYELFVAGKSVMRRAMPGGVQEIKNAENYARIGSAGPFSGRRWQGDIAEIVVYDRALDDSDRQDLEEYLSCQYFPEDT